MAGRPTKLTPEVHNAIVNDIELGVIYKDAVGAAGVSYPTFLSWLERGKAVRDGELRKTKSNKPFLEFLNSVERAKHTAFAMYAKEIQKASKKDWRAAESFLKRRDPENWGDKQENTDTHKGEILIRYESNSDNASEDAQGPAADQDGKKTQKRN